MNFCPVCNRLTEYDSYFDRYYCTSCNYRSSLTIKEAIEKVDKISEKLEKQHKEHTQREIEFNRSFEEE